MEGTSVGREPDLLELLDPNAIEVEGRDVMIERDDGGLGIVILPSPQKRGVRVVR
jgi:hypothetical protein